MRPSLENVFVAACAVAIGLLTAGVSRAGLVAEWDFRVDTNLTANKPGTNNVSQTRVGTHSTAANAGVNAPHQDRVRFGSFTPAFSTSGPYDPNNTPGLSTTGSNGEWQDYMGGTGYQSGTVVAVFKPNFATTATNTIFNVGNYTNDNVLTMGNLEITSGNARPGLRMRYSGGVGFLRLDTYSWDSSRWYMMATSWTVGGQAHLYLRELTGANPQSYFVSTGDPSQPGNVTNGQLLAGEFLDVGNIRLSVPPYNSGPFTTNGANSPIALVGLFDTFTPTRADFDTLYTTYVYPEPASIVLLLLGLTGMAGRGQRRVRPRA